MKNNQLRYMTQAAMIAALYVVLVFIFKPISFGAIQVRIAEVLTILPFFTPAAIPGVAIGCLLANFLNGADMLDVVFGTIATLIGVLGAYGLRKYRFLVPVPTILANTIIIPWVLRYAYGLTDAIPFLMFTVGVGEVISAGVLGMLLLFALDKYKVDIFGLDNKATL